MNDDSLARRSMPSASQCELALWGSTGFWMWISGCLKISKQSPSWCRQKEDRGGRFKDAVEPHTHARMHTESIKEQKDTGGFGKKEERTDASCGETQQTEWERAGKVPKEYFCHDSIGDLRVWVTLGWDALFYAHSGLYTHTNTHTPNNLQLRKLLPTGKAFQSQSLLQGTRVLMLTMTFNIMGENLTLTPCPTSSSSV